MLREPDEEAGFTPLYHAALQGHAEAAGLLLARGAVIHREGQREGPIRSNRMVNRQY